MLLRLDQLLLDARFGLRQLVRSPLVAAVAILTLAIGIGLNTAVFTLVNAVLLRPLPYPDSERLVWIAPYDERCGQDTFASRGDYLVWKQQTHVFEKMAAYGTQDLNLIVGGEASQERVASIGGDFWEITGARPMLGRLPADDDEQGVVLSYGLFQRRFGGSADNHWTSCGDRRGPVHHRGRASGDIPRHVPATDGAGRRTPRHRRLHLPATRSAATWH